MPKRAKIRMQASAYRPRPKAAADLVMAIRGQAPEPPAPASQIVGTDAKPTLPALKASA